MVAGIVSFDSEHQCSLTINNSIATYEIPMLCHLSVPCSLYRIYICTVIKFGFFHI